MKTAFFLTAVLAAQCALASDTVWSNIVSSPGDLQSTGDGWSATRAEDVGSYRIAADDFVLTTRTRITGVTYYSVQVGNPVIFGGDMYIYSFSGGQPGTLVTGQSDLALSHTDTGWFNSVFMSNVYENTMHPVSMELPAGHYFLAFRTVESRVGGAKNGALSTRVALGSARANWNFDVSQDGTVNLAWMTMDAFNGIRDQEWAFDMHGQAVVTPSGYTINLGRQTSGNLASLQEDDGNVLTICKFITPNQLAAPITVQIDGTVPFTTCSSYTFSMKSRMVHNGLYSQTLDLWNWSTGDWDVTDTRTDVVNTAFSVRDLNATGALSRLVNSATGAVRARYRIRQTGPGAASIWCHEVDRAAWFVSP